MHHSDKWSLHWFTVQVIAFEINSLKIKGLDLDTIRKRIGQLKTNAFAIQNLLDSVNATGPQHPRGLGLYVPQSIFDHSCVPNALRSHNGAIFTIRAAQEIDTDRENVFISYAVNSMHDTRETRMKSLRNDYFFECTCRLCTDPEAERQLQTINKLRQKLANGPFDVSRMDSVFDMISTIYEKTSALFGEHSGQSLLRLQMLIDQKGSVFRNTSVRPTPSDIRYWRKFKRELALIYGINHPYYKALIANYGHNFNWFKNRWTTI